MPVNIAQVLREKRVDVLVSYLPVGSETSRLLLRGNKPLRRDARS